MVPDVLAFRCKRQRTQEDEAEEVEEEEGDATCVPDLLRLVHRSRDAAHVEAIAGDVEDAPSPREALVPRVELVDAIARRMDERACRRGGPGRGHGVQRFGGKRVRLRGCEKMTVREKC